MISSGSGTKSILAKYSSPTTFSYCIVADNSTGPGLVAYTKNGPIFTFPASATTNLFCLGSTVTFNSSCVSVVQLSSSGTFLWKYTQLPLLTRSIRKCVADYFDNIYVSFSQASSALFFVVKIKSDGSAYTWSKYSNLLQNNDFFVTQDCVYITYTSNSYNSVYSNNSRTITVPAGLTGVDVFDANGNFITFYSVPTDIPSDFTNKTKDTYYTPLFDSSYFSNASNYNYTKLYKNFWGVFVDGTPSGCSLATDASATDVVFTAQYGPASSSEIGRAHV